MLHASDHSELNTVSILLHSPDYGLGAYLSQVQSPIPRNYAM